MKKSAQKTKSKIGKIKIGEFIKKWMTPILTAAIVFVLSIAALVLKLTQTNTQSQPEATLVEVNISSDNIALPTPDYKSSNSIEAVLKNRRTRLDFTNGSLTLKQISQILWAAQGVNVDWGDRTAPSMKSTYPLTLFLIVNNVEGLDSGEYQYIPGERTVVHQLKTIKKTEMGDSLYKMLNQSSFKEIPAIIVVSGDMAKMAEAYGGISHNKEVYLEAGYVAQNINLQVESLKLGTNITTNFDELKLKELITVADNDTIIYLMPLGIPK